MKSNISCFIFLLLYFYSFSSDGCVIYYPDTIAGASIYTYKKIDDISLNLQILKSEKESAPTVVFFYGGGWKGGTVQQFEPHMRYLLNQGITTVAVDYRVYSRHRTQPVQAVQDAMDAIIYIKQNAEDLNIDADRIAAAGGSAGGHLAAATAILKHLYPDVAITPEPDALILFNPVINTMPEGYGFERLQDMAWVLSPAHHVTASLPPTIIFHGTNDKTVPFQNILDFEKTMKQKNNQVEVKSFPGKGHAFFNYGRNQNKEYDATIEMMHHFLLSLGFISEQ